MRKMLLIALMLLVASTSMAREITPLKADLIGPSASRYDGDCVVGNADFDNILGYYDSWFLGYESYAIPFNAADESCVCSEGVAVKAIHMLIALDEFANLEVSASVLDAVDGGSGCLVPGAEIATSDVYTINGLTELGYVDIEIPIEGPCATTGDALFLAVNFLNDNDSQFFGIPISDGPVNCFNYNEFGSGYIDVVADYGVGGNLLIWADLECCAQAVSNEASTMDSIKSLYR